MKQISFLLIPEFPLYGLTPAIEALRIANQYSQTRVYEWKFVSADGKPVAASNGMIFDVSGCAAEHEHSPFVFVLAGNHPRQHLSKSLLNWLRRLDRHGATLGMIDTGAFVLAEAGLLGSEKITTHWEAIEMFRAEYPDLNVVDQLYCHEGKRWSCAGGHAVLDMMIEIIRGDCGPSVAQLVSDSFLHPPGRYASHAQRPTIQDLAGTEKRLFAQVVSVMSDHVAEPLVASDICRLIGVSRRELHRIVMDAAGIPPMRYYLRLRLQSARNTLFYSDRAIADVAYEHGFCHPEVFSRAFRLQFNMSPREFRNNYSKEQLRRFRPELSSNIVVQTDNVQRAD